MHVEMDFRETDFVSSRRMPVPLSGRGAVGPTTIADLHLPAGLVHAHAARMADVARAGGARHSMGLWRDACRAALEDVSRHAAGLPDTATCEALFWQIEGDEYHVSVTFALPASRVTH